MVFFEGLLGLISLGFDAGELLAQVTVLIAALLGFVFPLVSTVFDFGELTHRLRSLTSPHGDRRWEGRLHWTCSERIERLAMRCTWVSASRHERPRPPHKERP